MGDKPQNQRNWNREEAIILIAYYKKRSEAGINRSQIELEVSELLRKIALVNGETITETFRNKAGISGQLSGLLASMEGKDSRVGIAIKEVGKEFLNDPQSIMNEAESIVDKYLDIDSQIIANNYDEKEDRNLIEGLEKESIIKTRVNQGVFRDRLLLRYNKCHLCNIKSKDLLVASHIKPWKISNSKEKVDSNNGLLLCPNHDKLFDKGLISFDDNGLIMISSQLDKNEAMEMGIKSDCIIDLNPQTMKYMVFHRTNVYKG